MLRQTRQGQNMPIRVCQVRFSRAPRRFLYPLTKMDTLIGQAFIPTVNVVDSETELNPLRFYSMRGGFVR